MRPCRMTATSEQNVIQFQPSRVDGASGWRLFVWVTLPQLRSPMMQVTILQFLACFQAV